MGSLEELDNLKFVIYTPALPSIKTNVNRTIMCDWSVDITRIPERVNNGWKHFSHPLLSRGLWEMKEVSGCCAFLRWGISWHIWMGSWDSLTNRIRWSLLYLSSGLKKQVPSYDGNFYVLTWLDHGVPRYLATRYCWVRLCECFRAKLAFESVDSVKQCSFPSGGSPPPVHWGPEHKGGGRKRSASPAGLSELRHSSFPALSPWVLRSLNSDWMIPPAFLGLQLANSKSRDFSAPIIAWAKSLR